MTLISYESKNDIAHIRLCRADRRNAINTEMSARLHEAWKRFEHSSDRVALLTADGEHFCAGVDLADASPQAWKGVPNVGVPLSKPLVVATSGWTVGAGFTLTMMSDICIADDTTRFLFPEAKAGIFGGITASLVSRIPHKIAMEFLMMAEPLAAQRAYEVGLVNRVVDKGTHQEAALEYAEKLARLSPAVLRTIKLAVARTLPRSPAETAYPDMGELNDLMTGPDAVEGVAAFKEKREPRFANP